MPNSKGIPAVAVVYDLVQWPKIGIKLKILQMIGRYLGWLPLRCMLRHS